MFAELRCEAYDGLKGDGKLFRHLEDENTGLKELDASQRDLDLRIRSHFLAEIEGGNVGELGEFARPVRLVMEAPLVENSWSCSGYAW